MHIYFSGIGGVGIGPLAQIALDAGYDVSGSDITSSPTLDQFDSRASVAIGQDGSQIATAHSRLPIDWFVYTAALPEDHPELLFASENGIRTSKRDELLAHIITDTSQQLVAVAGTHGKTTTTAMLTWMAQQLSVPASYSIGTRIPFGHSGTLVDGSSYFFYECDEFDRNFLHFSPHISILTAIDYDHPDTYPTVQDYKDAFKEFVSQSEILIGWDGDFEYLCGSTIEEDIISAIQSQFPDSRLKHVVSLDHNSYEPLQYISLPGAHMRRNGALALTAFPLLVSPASKTSDWDTILHAINSFPGTSRRFEKLADNLYSDYGHHPKEIEAMMQLALEVSEHVVVVYQPHQNKRQHLVQKEYATSFIGAEKIYWLPTYLSREGHDTILTPAELISNLDNKDRAEPAELDDTLWTAINEARSSGRLVLCLGAGSIDQWLRDRLASTKF